MNPPIDTRTPIARDRPVKNLTGESSYAPENFSGSGGACSVADALPSGKSLFGVRFDRERRPILSDGGALFSVRRGVGRFRTAVQTSSSSFLMVTDWLCLYARRFWGMGKCKSCRVNPES